VIFILHLTIRRFQTFSPSWCTPLSRKKIFCSNRLIVHMDST